MIAREIREDRGREAQEIDPLQRQRVRRHFHHAGATALVHHLAEHRLQLGRLWSRPLRLDFLAADAVADGADASALDAGGLEDRREQVDVVVLPLVPVMPTRISRSLGSSWKIADSAASASAASGTCTHGAETSAGAADSDSAQSRRGRSLRGAKPCRRRSRRAAPRTPSPPAPCASRRRSTTPACRPTPPRRHGNAGPIGKLLQQDAERHCGRPPAGVSRQTRAPAGARRLAASTSGSPAPATAR